MLSVPYLKPSRWSLLFCILAALAFAIMPMGAAAKVFLAGGDDRGGDPLDGNDHGTNGSSGGSGDDIHDALNTTPIPTLPDRPTLFGFYVVIVPSRTSALGFELVLLAPMPPTDVEDVHAR